MRNTNSLKKAVFLDRDGVINEMVYNPDFGLIDSPSNASQFRLTHGAGEAIQKLNSLGFYVFVVSNQPGIAKGKLTIELLHGITKKMIADLAEHHASIDNIYYCMHHPESVIDELRMKCNCRKPKPGLLEQACQDYPVDIENSYMIGDGLTDIQAGKAIGCKTILVGKHKCDVCKLKDDLDARADMVVTDLMEGVRRIEQMEVYDENIYRLSEYK
jgi:D-glycero-D-manno-heptose 1,7-bisphosphate phosphatase